MSNMRVYGIGRIAKNPEIRYTAGENPKAVANISIACNRSYKSKDGESIADFFNCTAFGQRAEFIEKYMHKGMKVFIEGDLQQNSYETKEGEKRTSVNIVISSIEFAESKNASSSTPRTDSEPEQVVSEPEFMEDDDVELPFN